MDIALAAPLPDLAPGVGICDTPDGLATINDTGIELVIWRRVLPLCLHNWLEHLDTSRLPDLRVLVRPRDFRRAAELHLDECGIPAGDMRKLLLADAEGLVSAFARITRSDIVDVRLERVSHDACWKFHRDSVEARMLTTYCGPGTEWVLPIHAEQALREQKRFSGPIEQLHLHDVTFFKGSRAEEGDGIVHRSPPIAGTGRTRLLLCVNKLSQASPPLWSETSRHA